MSQDRMSNSSSEPAKATDTYQAPNIEATLSRATKAVSKVRVVHGANEQYFDNLEGKTVGMVRKSLREVFNIPGDAEALIAGKNVQDDFVLEGGMNLEFVKEAGVKGIDLTLSDDEQVALRWALTDTLNDSMILDDAPYAASLIQDLCKRLGGELETQKIDPLEDTPAGKQWYEAHSMCETCCGWFEKGSLVEVEEEGFKFEECKECHAEATLL